MKKITVCLGFNDQAAEATAFYTSLFKHTKRGALTPQSVTFELEGLPILGLNSDVTAPFTPSNSFFVWCENEDEMQRLWRLLSAQGDVHMRLDTYPWASRYGWTADKYGVEWQLILHPQPQPQKIAPAFLFVDDLFGRGEEAVKFYTSLFRGSRVETMVKDEKTHSVMHCVFSILGQRFVLMEGPGQHRHSFSTAYSLVAPCDSQDEIDELRAKLTQGGSVEPNGWIKDKFGMFWQVVPQARVDFRCGAG